MLGKVRVLVLIDQHIFEVFRIVLTYFREVLKEQVGVYQQVIKVHGIALLAAFDIQSINLVKQGDVVLLVNLQHFPIHVIIVWEDQEILGQADTRLDGTRLIHFLVQLQILYDRLDHALGVGSIVNSVFRIETQSLRLRAQDACKDRMKRSHPQVTGFFPHLAGNTFFHLTGRLVGKRQG